MIALAGKLVFTKLCEACMGRYFERYYKSCKTKCTACNLKRFEEDLFQIQMDSPKCSKNILRNAVSAKCQKTLNPQSIYKKTAFVAADLFICLKDMFAKPFVEGCCDKSLNTEA